MLCADFDSIDLEQQGAIQLHQLEEGGLPEANHQNIGGMLQDRSASTMQSQHVITACFGNQEHMV